MPDEARARIAQRLTPVREKGASWVLNTVGNEAFRKGLAEVSGKADSLFEVVQPAISTLQMRNWGNGLEQVTRAGTLVTAGLGTFKLLAKQADRASQALEKQCTPPRKVQAVKPVPNLVPIGHRKLGRGTLACTLLRAFLTDAEAWKQAEVLSGEALDGLFEPEVREHVYAVFRIRVPASDLSVAITISQIAAKALEAQKDANTPRPGFDGPFAWGTLFSDPTLSLALLGAPTKPGPSPGAAHMQAALVEWFWLRHAKAHPDCSILHAPAALGDWTRELPRHDETKLSRMLQEKQRAVQASGRIRVVLLYGPPGLGKTVAAEQVGSASGRGLYLQARDLLENCSLLAQPTLPAAALSNPEIEFGEANEAYFVRHAVSMLRPRVLVIDELDAVMERSDPRAWMEELSALRGSLNVDPGIFEGTLVIITANKPQAMDPALLRPGRIDEVIHVTPEMVGDARFAALDDLPLTAEQRELVSQWPAAYITELRRRRSLYGPDWQAGDADVEVHVHELEWRRKIADAEYAAQGEWGQDFRRSQGDSHEVITATAQPFGAERDARRNPLPEAVKKARAQTQKWTLVTSKTKYQGPPSTARKIRTTRISPPPVLQPVPDTELLNP